MLDLTEPGSTWIPLSVLGASLLGSAHCVGMCGGLVVSVCRTPWESIRYHFGRLVSYLALGAVAGFFGKALFQNPGFKWFPWMAAVLMGSVFLWMGIGLWRGKPLHLKWMPSRLFQYGFQKWKDAPVFLGFFSAFLPCGWLQTFVLGAATTQNVGRGALLLFLFWIGTIPALSAAPWLIHKGMRPFAQKAPKVAALILIAIGLAGIGQKMSVFWTPPSGAHCELMRK